MANLFDYLLVVVEVRHAVREAERTGQPQPVNLRVVIGRAILILDAKLTISPNPADAQEDALDYALLVAGVRAAYEQARRTGQPQPLEFHADLGAHAVTLAGTVAAQRRRVRGRGPK